SRVHVRGESAANGLDADYSPRRAADPGLAAGEEHQAADIGVVRECGSKLVRAAVTQFADGEVVVASETTWVRYQAIEACGEGGGTDQASNDHTEGDEAPDRRRSRAVMAGKRELTSGGRGRAGKSLGDRVRHQGWRPRRAG